MPQMLDLQYDPNSDRTVVLKWIKPANEGNWVRLDYESGGYPCRVRSVLDAKRFVSYEEAKNYCSHFEEQFSIHRIDSIFIKDFSS